MKSCADCVCMVRTAKRNWCKPATSRTPTRWQQLGWKSGALYIHLDEVNFGFAYQCLRFKPREEQKP